nr:hypothetical protein [uncultured Massilia sp.]
MFRNKYALGLALAAAVVAALPGVVRAAGHSYKVTELVPFTPGQGAGVPVAINNRGMVCGYLADNTGFCWYRGTLTPLTPLPGDAWGLPNGVNDLNQVVGRSYGPAGLDHAVIFVDGAARPLSVASHLSSTANDIDNLGRITGSYGDAANESIAFVSFHGIVRPLGSLGGPLRNDAGTGINDLGQVVGLASKPGSDPNTFARIAFEYRHGVMRALPLPAGYTASWAVRNNLLGQAAGAIEITGADLDARRPALWSRGGVTTLIDAPGDARDINNLGQVVGGLYGREGGFLYTPGGGARSLNDFIDPASGYSIVYPQAINDLGQIAAFACKAQRCGPVRLDPAHRLLAEPAPEEPGIMRRGEE